MLNLEKIAPGVYVRRKAVSQGAKILPFAPLELKRPTWALDQGARGQALPSQRVYRAPRPDSGPKAS